MSSRIRREGVDGRALYIQTYWSNPAMRAESIAKTREGALEAWADPKKCEARKQKMNKVRRTRAEWRKKRANEIPPEYQELYEQTARVMGRREALAQIRLQVGKDKLKGLVP